MSTHANSFFIQGAAGNIEVLHEAPSPNSPVHGTAVLAHPNPAQGGTMQHKVVQTMARACVQAGWHSIRFQFRGVGQSDGTHDYGKGEVDDMRAVIEQTATQDALIVGGFSFGAFVAAQVAHTLLKPQVQQIQKMLLCGTACGRFAVPEIDAALHPHTLVLHGVQDEVIPLSDVLNWAKPQHTLPVTVLPEAGHFFHGQLNTLKQLIWLHLGYTP